MDDETGDYNNVAHTVDDKNQNVSPNQKRKIMSNNNDKNPFLHLVSEKHLPDKLGFTVTGLDSLSQKNNHDVKIDFDHETVNGTCSNDSSGETSGSSGSTMFTAKAQHENSSQNPKRPLKSISDVKNKKASTFKNSAIVKPTADPDKKATIIPVFSNVLIIAMKKQKPHFPMVYIGSPSISDKRVQSGKHSKLLDNDKVTASEVPVGELSKLQPTKENAETTEEAEFVQSMLSTAAENITDLQRVLKSLNDVQTHTSSSMYTKLLSELSSTTVNDFDPPSMVQVFPSVDRMPKIESINYINNKTSVLQNRWQRVSQPLGQKIQIKPITAVTNATPTVKISSIASKPVSTKKQKLFPISPNHVISVPLTFPSKSILQLASQSNIPMTAKVATKLSSSTALKVLASKVKSSAPLRTMISTVSMLPTTTTVVKTTSAPSKMQHFSLKVVNPPKAMVKKVIHTRVSTEMLPTPNPSDVVIGQQTSKKNIENTVLTTTSSGTKRKGEEIKSISKKPYIAEKDTNVTDSKQFFKGKPGALVRFEDGVEMWIDKIKDITFVDDEPIKSWALKPGTEVAVKFTDGLFYDAVIVRSYAGSNNSKPDVGNSGNVHKKTDTAPSTTNSLQSQTQPQEVAKPQLKKVQTKVQSKQELCSTKSSPDQQMLISKVPQVKIAKLDIKVPIVIKNEKKATVKENSSEINTTELAEEIKWTKCTNCFLVFSQSASHRLHQKTVCGGIGYVFKGGEFPLDKDIVVDESSDPPLVKNARKWRKSGDSNLFLARDGKRWFKRGTRFLHRWQTEGNKSKWYNGMVRSVLSSSNSKDAKCHFEVEYSDDDHDNGPYSIALYEDFPHDIRIVLR